MGVQFGRFERSRIKTDLKRSGVAFVLNNCKVIVEIGCCKKYSLKLSGRFALSASPNEIEDAGFYSPRGASVTKLWRCCARMRE